MKSVLITGTSKGFGYALLEEFLNEGWIVFALARNVSLFSKLSEQYKNTCVSIEADVTNENVSKLIDEIIKSRTDHLDLLINNAGNAELCFGIDNVTPMDLENHFKVHVSGVFRVIKTCLPFLIKSIEPIIVNVSSRKGSINKINSGAYRILLPYQIAKAAQNMLTVGLNQELKDTNIKVYAIQPGNLKTDVAPIDADTEPHVAAETFYQWITSENKLSTQNFYDLMNNTSLDW
ncbi:MAG: SDR family NAD(P)-dependent oxidoreductase [Bacteroidales bacterium]|nr:SDR family NAD(P)-dependent oxidoreductase [Bacteroidales bacterium]